MTSIYNMIYLYINLIYLNFLIFQENFCSIFTNAHFSHSFSYMFFTIYYAFFLAVIHYLLQNILVMASNNYVTFEIKLGNSCNKFPLAEPSKCNCYFAEANYCLENIALNFTVRVHIIPYENAWFTLQIISLLIDPV